jgi:hypothetical protein
VRRCIRLRLIASSYQIAPRKASTFAATRRSFVVEIVPLRALAPCVALATPGPKIGGSLARSAPSQILCEIEGYVSIKLPTRATLQSGRGTEVPFGPCGQKLVDHRNNSVLRKFRESALIMEKLYAPLYTRDSYCSPLCHPDRSVLRGHPNWTRRRQDRA